MHIFLQRGDKMKLIRMLPAVTFVVFLVFTGIQVSAQTDSPDQEKNIPHSKHSIGSSLFILGNLAPGDPPHFFLLNYSYRLTRKDIIFLEAITWTYYEPLGSYGSTDKRYPGKIRAYGAGAGYQRFLWRKFYVTVQATPFYQQFFDHDNKKVAGGFQLYLQSRLGYRFEFFNERIFIEPSVSFNYWPVNTNFPADFKEVESGEPDYFLFEPGLHFGIRF
jgi:hypothetical protein